MSFPGALTDDGQRRNPAFVLLFAVFDESKSWYGEVGERKSREMFKRSMGIKEYHTINGYVNSTLPGKEPDRLWTWCLFHVVVLLALCNEAALYGVRTGILT